MPPKKQEPPVRPDAAEKTHVNGKLLESAEAVSAETATAARQRPGTRKNLGAKTTADAKSIKADDGGDTAAKTRASRRKGTAGKRAETGSVSGEAADKPRASRRKTGAGAQPADPQLKEAPEAASPAEETAPKVISAAEPDAATSIATAEVKTAATDTAEDAAPVLQLLETRLKKKERNETHDKDRVFIRKDLKLRLDALAENRSKGFKTLLLNYGLEKALDELEQAEAAREED